MHRKPREPARSPVEPCPTVADCLPLDGVYVEQDGQLVFHPLGEPSAEDIEYVARRTFERAKRLLRRRGLLDGERLDADGCADPLQTDHAALAHCYDAAVRGIEQFGKRTGQPTLRLIDPSAGSPDGEARVRAVRCRRLQRLRRPRHRRS